MRVTNTMLANNSIINMAKNKEDYAKYLQQYNSQKKISKPSDDPVIAARSLKYRTNLIEISQYVDKNIPDAISWMDSTEAAMKQMNKTLEEMSDYCTQGANGTLESDDRSDIAATLKQYKESFYEQQGNANIAGRYLFTGYRTDVPLLFDKDSSNLTYNITETFNSTDLSNFSYVYGCAEYDAANNTAANYAQNAPEYLQAHRITLAYDQVDASAVTIKYTDSDGNEQTISATKNAISDNVKLNGQYKADADEVFYVPETGEVILGENAYQALQSATDISVNYTKTDFKKNDIRPEHYYTCESKNNTTGEIKTYSNTTDQKMEYEINFNQTLQVNTLGCNAIDTGLGRKVDEMLKIINDIDTSESKLKDIEKRIEATDQNDTAKLDALTELKTQVNNEITLKNKMLTDCFSTAISTCQDTQSTLSVATADHGARYKRLTMTQNKLTTQKTDFEKILSDNEDVDLGEAYIKYNQADLLYQATLSATSKVLGNTLLDFI